MGCDGKILTSRTRVQACGLRTCAFIIVETTAQVIGWHVTAENMPGNPKECEMSEVLLVLTSIGNNFVRGFAIPGTELDDELAIRDHTSFMRGLGSSHSKYTLSMFVRSKMNDLPWWPRMVTTRSLENETDVVEYTKGSQRPVVFENSGFRTSKDITWCLALLVCMVLMMGVRSCM